MDRAVLGALRSLVAVEQARTAEERIARRLKANSGPARAALRRREARSLRAIERTIALIARRAGWDGETPLDVLEERAGPYLPELGDEPTPVTKRDLGPLIRETRRTPLPPRARKPSRG